MAFAVSLLAFVRTQKFEEVPMKLSVVLEPSEEGGYTVYVPSLPGCISEGESKDEALKNIREAVELYLEAVEDDTAYGPDSEIAEVAV
jgi:predicted RNase H-like HicB family nuclease